MRPSAPLVTTTSLTARPIPLGCSTSSVGSSTTSYSPAKTRARPASRSRLPIELRKPDPPEVDADDGNARAEEARERAQHRPVAAEHDREVGRREIDRGLEAVLLRFLGGKTSSTPFSAATACSRASPAPICLRLPVGDDRGAATVLADGLGDPAVDVIGIRLGPRG